MNSINYEQSGIVFDIQRYSIHDGPGIRTVIFLKGCPLRCAWCSNPESQRSNPDLMFRKNLCIYCDCCIKSCKYDAIGYENPNWIDREKCVLCGECALVCPASALVMKGKKMTVEDVIKEAKKDDSYYWNSGGGITLSGGEALVQPQFAKEVFKAASAQGWNTALETEAYVKEEVLRDVLPYVDLVLLDIKAFNSDLHKKWTGVRNELILSNAKVVQEIANTIIRVPVIPGVNADKDEFTDIVNFATTLPNIKELHILPYHRFGEGKYDALGRDYRLDGFKELEPEYVQELKEVVEDRGLLCHVGG